MPSSFRSPRYISEANEIKSSDWEAVGNSRSALKEQLGSLYWDGVRQELKVILFTLKKLQQSDSKKVLEKEQEILRDDTPFGFETFVDQVSLESRSSAYSFGKQVEKYESKEKLLSTYEDAIYHKISSENAKQRSNNLNAAIKSSVLENETKDDLTPIERYARSLLRTAGFLDMEKVIEHRPTLEKFNFWNRKGVPQMAFTGLTKHIDPIFERFKCGECNQTIHGSMFKKTENDDKGTISLCEDCYRKRHYGDLSYAKKYQHCPFTEGIDGATSRALCTCPKVPHFDDNGEPIALFPVDPREQHIEFGLQACGLFRLIEGLARAKYATIRRDRIGLASTSVMMRFLDLRPKKDTAKHADDDGWLDDLEEESEVSMPSSTYGVADLERGEEEIPFYLRHYTKKYPFGNVHMALRIGPLTIENGVANTKGGALISLRDPPRLLAIDEPKSQRLIAISPNLPRTIYTQTRDKGAWEPKRIKAVMKQVIGSPFSGISDLKKELQVIRELVRASQLKSLGDPGLSRAEQHQLLERILDHLLGRLKVLFRDRLDTYLTDLTMKLFHPSTIIRWNARKNNCQNFCDALINIPRLGQLIDKNIGTKKPPLYLMSFVCRKEAYPVARVRTKLDVPSGLTEEYLLKFRFGLHQESDIVDSLHEYWHDWGAFGTHLYPFQDLFPWDCSEAFGRHPIACSHCNISKHVWAFPYDSWSIISLHLSRDRFLYASPAATAPATMTDEAWLHNRLTLLSATDALTAAAVAMARNKDFRRATAWLKHDSNAEFDRVRLGGIHRAQPWSKFFVRGAYNHFLVAEWAHLRREDQIAAYELLRNFRMEMLDVGVTRAKAAQMNVINGGPGCTGAAAASSAPVDLGAICGPAYQDDGNPVCAACGAGGAACIGGGVGGSNVDTGGSAAGMCNASAACAGAGAGCGSGGGGGGCGGGGGGGGGGGSGGGGGGGCGGGGGG